MIRGGYWAGGIVALACAFLLGQKIESDRSRDGLFDAINRIAGTQYTILDLSVRTLHHTNPNHMKGNPFCPECFDILNRIKSHDKVVNVE